MWENRARRLLLTACLASAFVGAQLVLFVLKAIFRIHLPNGLLDYCMMLLRWIGFPINMPLMTLLAASSLFAGTMLLLKQAAFAARWKKLLHTYADTRRSSSLAKRYGFKKTELTIIRCPDPIAMTVGFARPRIFLSTGLIGLLDRNELDAVMAHERFHLQRKDPMALFFLSLIRKAFWYVPMLKWLQEKYALAIEILADRQAMSSTSGISDLGGALLKLAKNGPLPKISVLNASFAETSINLRIRMILEPQFEPAFKLPVARIVLSLLAAALIAIMA